MDACNLGKFRAPLSDALVVVDILSLIYFHFLQSVEARPINMRNNELYWARDT